MIPVSRVKEPPSFEATARKPGKAWLEANKDSKKRPKDFWSPHLAALAAGFTDLCGYAAMLDPTGGTVDHYLSCVNHRKLAYEWSNYRFASQVMNASKRTADETVLDPHEVGAGWFEILLPSLEMKLTPRVPAKHRTRAAFTLRRLKLDNGEKIIRWRQKWYELYTDGKMTLAALERVAPLLAAAVVRESKKAGTRTRRRRTP